MAAAEPIQCGVFDAAVRTEAAERGWQQADAQLRMLGDRAECDSRRVAENGRRRRQAMGEGLW